MTPAGNDRSTERLILRRWREADHEPFAALNADPGVMDYFPARLTRAESDQLIARIEAGFDQHGYGLWALELRATGKFIGFTGLDIPSFEAHFTPAVEVGWRLARSAWGQGYATEAGRASLAFGFEEAGLDEIVSFTSAVNMRSRAVMSDSQQGETIHAVVAMSAETSAARTERPASSTRTLTERLRITRRGIQIALGYVWLLDGVLQFQSFMYSHAFITEVIEPTASGQPGVIREPILMFAHFYGHDLTLWNTLSALIQCAIGLGLILSRRTVRPALFASYFWALIIWWLGEGLGELFSGVPASPLQGAPGAVLVYLMVGLLVWPKDENADGMPVDGGLLGRLGALVVWSVIWLDAAVLWLLHVDRSKEAITEQISGMAEGSPHWLATAQSSLAKDLRGDGVTIATVLAILSVLIAAGVWTRLRPVALVIGAALSLLYWVYGQSLGGPFWIGGATDPNAGPLLVLLAATVWTAPKPATSRARASDPGAKRQLRAGAA